MRLYFSESRKRREAIEVKVCEAICVVCFCVGMILAGFLIWHQIHDAETNYSQIDTAYHHRPGLYEYQKFTENNK